MDENYSSKKLTLFAQIYSNAIEMAVLLSLIVVLAATGMPEMGYQATVKKCQHKAELKFKGNKEFSGIKNTVSYSRNIDGDLSCVVSYGGVNIPL